MPSHQHASRQRGYRMCDTCDAVEQPGQPRFRMCGGCMITQYCSTECQKAHWPSHRAICQHTASTIKATKVEPTFSDENLARNLRRFCSAHVSLLNWSVFQALQLRRMPVNIRQQALLVELAPRKHEDPARRFTIKSTHIVSRSYVESFDALVAEDIKRREERCIRSGGIGTAIILVQCGGLSQLIPAECDNPRKITWDLMSEWEDVLACTVEDGRVDFLPRTTTSRGVIYG